MLKYGFWRNALNVVYWIEWWAGRSVVNIESKFFKAEIDYHAKHDDWSDVFSYITDDEEDDEGLEDDDEE
jgi:hypothetical protein